MIITIPIIQFLEKFKSEMRKENESKGEIPLDSLYDPVKSVFSFHMTIST